jgi:hypothetical protein
MSLFLISVYLYNYFSKHRYFKILEATTYRFLEETYEAKNLIACRIKIMMKRSEDGLVFDELWMEDRLYKIKITDEENQQVDAGFSKRQVLYIDVESEISYTDRHIFPPENLKSKIFLGYMIGNKRKFFPVNASFEEVRQREVA